MTEPRLTVSEVARRLLDNKHESSESITLRRNARGDTQPEVVAVAKDGETLADAAERASSVYARLLAAFPAVSTTTEGEG